MIIKLRNRLVVTIMAFVSIVVLVAFVAIYMVTYVRIYNENTDKIGREEMVTITSDGRMVLDGKEITDAFVINRTSPDLGVHFNVIADVSGKLVYTDSVLNLSMEDYALATSIAINNMEGGITELAGRKWRYGIVVENVIYNINDHQEFANSDGLKLIRYLDITDSYQTLETLLVTLCGLYIALMILFFLLARFFANRSLHPMTEAWESQRRFIADASHELKTPICTLNTHLDILYASQDDTIKEQVKWLDNSKKVLSRMTNLIQSMLELAKMEESSSEYKVEDVYINNLLGEATDYYAPLMDKKSILLSEFIDGEVHVFSNYNMIQQVVEILMDNAVRYTNENGEIQICAYALKNHIVIKVQNTGDGIPTANIDKIFERFYRGDKARVYQEGNYGLGLSIAKSAVQKLDGKISVQSNSQQTSFTVKIPNKKRKAA